MKTQQLLQAGSSVRVLAHNPDKARRLLGNRAYIGHSDVADARSVPDAIAEDYRAIFLTVAAQVELTIAACSHQRQ